MESRNLPKKLLRAVFRSERSPDTTSLLSRLLSSDYVLSSQRTTSTFRKKNATTIPRYRKSIEETDLYKSHEGKGGFEVGTRANKLGKLYHLVSNLVITVNHVTHL